ncbi:hypothetical protein BIW11_11018 [Tropilaelaps mercedesae]|uniref:Uncharacterized protein n=1 Tax=Tropilaelaps mercedesae TaxID=418985 RepID=A0A1V9XCY3_9ACAR|nr:hypothetical protein BIW11_11018 [Tropilaelaps mercedesae]
MALMRKGSPNGRRDEEPNRRLEQRRRNSCFGSSILLTTMPNIVVILEYMTYEGFQQDLAISLCYLRSVKNQVGAYAAAAIGRVSLQHLGQFALCTALVCSGGMLYMQEVLRKKFKEQEYFKESMRVLLENPHVKSILGEPITSGKLCLYDRERFFATPEKAKLVIPVQGSKQKGMVYAWCTRQLPTRDSTVDEIARLDGEVSKEIAPTDCEKPSKQIPLWRVMRLEIRFELIKDKRLIVFRAPEADQHFIDTFDDVTNKDPSA